MQHVWYVICVAITVLLYVHNSVMGADRELEALDCIRNSSGSLIKHERTN